jgi:hypothetical protein
MPVGDVLETSYPSKLPDLKTADDWLHMMTQHLPPVARESIRTTIESAQTWQAVAAKSAKYACYAERYKQQAQQKPDRAESSFRGAMASFTELKDAFGAWYRGTKLEDETMRAIAEGLGRYLPAEGNGTPYQQAARLEIGLGLFQDPSRGQTSYSRERSRPSRAQSGPFRVTLPSIGEDEAAEHLETSPGAGETATRGPAMVEGLPPPSLENPYLATPQPPAGPVTRDADELPLTWHKRLRDLVMRFSPLRLKRGAREGDEQSALPSRLSRLVTRRATRAPSAFGVTETVQNTSEVTAVTPAVSAYRPDSAIQLNPRGEGRTGVDVGPPLPHRRLDHTLNEQGSRPSRFSFAGPSVTQDSHGRSMLTKRGRGR